MKKFLSVILAICIVLSLAACGSAVGSQSEDMGSNSGDENGSGGEDNQSSIQSESEDDGIARLNFVQSFALGEDAAYLQMLIDKFNTIDPAVQVSLISIPEDEMVDYILDENNKADIFTLEPYHTMDLYNADKLTSLESYLADALSSDRPMNELNELYLETEEFDNLEYYITDFREDAFTEIDGITYSLPLFSDTSVLFYSYKEIGATGSTTMITNYPGLIEIAEWGTNPDLDYYGISLLLTNKEPIKSATETILPILYGNNGSLMQGDVFTVDTPEMQATMQFIETLGTNGYLMPDTSQKTEEEILEDFSNEETILLISSYENYHIASAMNEVYPEHVYTHNLNKDYSNTMIDNSTNIAISEGCSDKDAAFEFVKFIAFLNRIMAVELDLFASIASESTYVRVSETKLLPNAEECLAELTKAGVAVLDGEKTPEEAIADCQAEWDRILLSE